MKERFVKDLKSKEDVETALTDLGLQGVWFPEEAGAGDIIGFETPDYTYGSLESCYTISWFPDHCELNLHSLRPSIRGSIRFSRISSPDDDELAKLRIDEKRNYMRRPKWKDKDWSAIDEWEWVTLSDPDNGTKMYIRIR